MGIGWRPEIGVDLLAAPDSIDFIEVVAEAVTTRAAERHIRALAETWPVVLHGVKLSLGSAEGFDRERALRFARLARAVGASAVSEHASFVRSGGIEIGHLTALPFSRAAIDVLARNVDGLRALLPDVPLLLENVAWSLRWPDDTLDEATFYRELVRATGCALLLDVGNLYGNALNAGRAPLELLAEFPLGHVAMLHVAGGVMEHGFYYDTHAHAVPEGVYELVSAVLAERPTTAVLLERDGAFEPFAPIAAELERLRAAHRSATRDGTAPSVVGSEAACAHRPSPLASAPTTAPEGDDRLRQRQDLLARVLTAATEPDVESADEEQARTLFGAPALARSRDILRRKRWDDALPLLPTLAPWAAALRPRGLELLERAPRPRRLVAVADALRLASAFGEEPCAALAAAARHDALGLRARFRGPDADGELQPRRGPFVARTEAAEGYPSIWVVKGLGTHAQVRSIRLAGAGGTRA